MTFCIEKFSSWFCFVYSIKEFYEIDYEHLHELPINAKRFQEIIDKLYEMYRDELMPVIDKMWNFEDCDDFYYYLISTMSKCVELSTTPTYLHFMLVCTFIRGIISQRFRRKMKCFTFVKITSQCLIGIYDRCYKDLFKDKSDSKAFQSYCKSLNTILAKRMTAKGRKTLSPFKQQQLTMLIASLEDIDDEGFELTKAEFTRFNKTESFLLNQNSSTDDDESTSRSVSDEKLWKEEINSNESESDEVDVKKEITNGTESYEVFVKKVDTNGTEFYEIHVKKEIKNGTESYEIDVKKEVNTNEIESYKIYVKKEANINEAEADETPSKEESCSNEAEADETPSKEESCSNDSEADETLSKESCSNDSEVDETLSKEESCSNDSEADETPSEEESCSNDSESYEASSEKESSSNDFEYYGTSSEEKNTFASIESFKTDDDDSDYTKRICKYCGWKCFEFLSSFEAGLHVKSEINF